MPAGVILKDCSLLTMPQLIIASCALGLAFTLASLISPVDPTMSLTIPLWQVVEAVKEFIDSQFPREEFSSPTVTKAAECSDRGGGNQRHNGILNVCRSETNSQAAGTAAPADPSSAAVGIATCGGAGGGGDASGCQTQSPWWENEEADPELIRR